MNLFLILLAVVTVYLLLIKLVAALTGRLSERFLTSYFRDLEALLEEDKLPVEWSRQVQQLTRGRPSHTNTVDLASREGAAKAFLMKKIRTLSNYFQSSPFVESPETRALLLERLETLIRRWEESELPEILADYQFSYQHDLVAGKPEHK